MGIRTLIVDDEPLARRGVTLRLSSYDDIEIVGECDDGEEALRAMTSLQPDLVFLDIQMPRLNGIEVLRSLQLDTTPIIIFLTAYDEYALAAFEVQALDYLLKPIDDERFAAALQRARQLLRMHQNDRLYASLQQLVALEDERKTSIHTKRFVVRNGKQLIFVPVEEVDWIEAAGDYAELHIGKSTHLVRESLNMLEGRLSHSNFVRVHRSVIVQLDRIRGFRSLPNRDGKVMLRDGQVMRVSRSYSGPLREKLSLQRSPA